MIIQKIKNQAGYKVPVIFNMGGKASKKTTSTKKSSTELSKEQIQLLLKETRFDLKQIEDWHAGFIVGFSFNLKILKNSI